MASDDEGQTAGQGRRRPARPVSTRGGSATSAGQRLARTRGLREQLAALERSTWGRQG